MENKEYKKPLTQDEFNIRMKHYITYWRRNVHRFAEFLGFKRLFLYQKIVLYLMNLYPMVVIVACRAAAKSYLVALFACLKCILYPGSKFVIASSTKKQASLIVTEKIQKELMTESPALAAEIKDIKTGQNQTEVIFHNGSSIVVVPATDNARGARGTCLVLEEFRMIEKRILDSVLSPFLIVRMPPYLSKPEYAHLKEEPAEIYISSAWYKSHWMWEHMKIAMKEQYEKKTAVLVGFDYAISLAHGLRTKKQLEKEKKKLSSDVFAMEYGNRMLGAVENCFFPYDIIAPCQKETMVCYPRDNLDVVANKKCKNKNDVEKLPGEIRILTADIALSAGRQNDNSAFGYIRAIPHKDFYERKLMYLETHNGMSASDQSIRLKQLREDFKIDYLVLDYKNVGISVYDELGKVQTDNERNVEYPAWTSMNNKEAQDRTKVKDAEEIIYTVTGSDSLNDRLHIIMKDALERGLFTMLVNTQKGRETLEDKIEYKKAGVDKKIQMELPFMEIDLLVNEMVNLSWELKNNKIKVSEPTTGTKDRYMSIGYGNYFITEVLEKDLQDEDEEKGWDDMPMLVSSVNWKI